MTPMPKKEEAPPSQPLQPLPKPARNGHVNIPLGETRRLD